MQKDEAVQDVIKDIPRPDETIIIRVAGVQKTIFMSAGLRGRLVSHLSGLEDIESVFVNPTLQETLILECVAVRSKRGDIEDCSTTDEISQSDAENLVSWVVDHVLYFFINGAARTKEMGKEGGAAQRLMLLLSGSQDSTENSPSAGPTEKSPAE